MGDRRLLRPLRPEAAIAVAVCLTAALPLPAQAYVCSRVPDASGQPTGPSLAWLTRTIPYAFNSQGTNQLSQTATFSAIRQSFQVWQNITTRPEAGLCTSSGTTDITFQEAAPTSQSFSGYNYLAPKLNQNIIVFRDQKWPHLGDARTVVALTTTTYNTLTGEIFDADIEFNTADYAFSTGDTNVKTDLMNTATHEIGHILGFAHSEDESATMFASAPPGELSKRRLACDDAAIIRFRYPAGGPVGYADPLTKEQGLCAKPGELQYTPAPSVRNTDDGRGGCQCQSTSDTAPAWFALLVALPLRQLRRRRAVP